MVPDTLDLNPANGFIHRLHLAVPYPCRTLYVCSDPDDWEKTDLYADSTAESLERAGFAFTEFAVLDGRNAGDAAALAASLREKGQWLLEHIRNNEFHTDSRGRGWFNGYYDGHGRPLEGERDGKARMTLTGQVFAVLSGAATDEQVRAVCAVEKKRLLLPVAQLPRRRQGREKAVVIGGSYHKPRNGGVCRNYPLYLGGVGGKNHPVVCFALHYNGLYPQNFAGVPNALVAVAGNYQFAPPLCNGVNH